MGLSGSIPHHRTTVLAVSTTLNTPVAVMEIELYMYTLDLLIYLTSNMELKSEKSNS